MRGHTWAFTWHTVSHAELFRRVLQLSSSLAGQISFKKVVVCIVAVLVAYWLGGCGGVPCCLHQQTQFRFYPLREL